jgi:hypothetical protein
MRHGTIASIFFATMLAGCSHYPLPVDEPKVPVGETKATPKLDKGGLPPWDDLKVGIDNLKVYGDHYHDVSANRRVTLYKSSDASLIGGVLGVLGGATKAVDVAIGGALVSSGSNIYTSRFNLTVQAENYEKAGDAMYCMYNAMKMAGPTAMDVMNNPEFRDILAEETGNVRRRLRDRQVKVQFSSPSLEELKRILQTETPSPTEAENKTQKVQLAQAEIRQRENNLIRLKAGLVTPQSLKVKAKQEFSTLTDTEIDAKAQQMADTQNAPTLEDISNEQTELEKVKAREKEAVDAARPVLQALYTKKLKECVAGH